MIYKSIYYYYVKYSSDCICIIVFTDNSYFQKEKKRVKLTKDPEKPKILFETIDESWVEDHLRFINEITHWIKVNRSEGRE